MKHYFEINGLEYSCSLIPLPSKERKPIKVRLLAPLFSRMDIDYYNKTKGRLEYVAGNSLESKEGKFVKRTIHSHGWGFTIPKLTLEEKPRKRVFITQEYSIFNSVKKSIITKQKIFPGIWKRIPSELLNTHP